MEDKPLFVIRMREVVERVYTTRADDAAEARRIAEAFEAEFDHDDGVTDWQVLSVKEVDR